MRSTSCIGLAAAALTLAAPSRVAGATTKVVSVDCTKGQNVSVALQTKADNLEIRIRGMCHEDVVIRRDHVTLIGADPNVDGIAAVDTVDIRGAAVYVRDARMVRLENLKLTGGITSGLRVHSSDTQTVVKNCRLEGNGRDGITAAQSVVVVEDSVMSDQPLGAIAALASQFFCTRCTMENVNVGLLAADGAEMTVSDSTITANSDGLQILNSANVFVTNTQLSGRVNLAHQALVTMTDVVQTEIPSNANLVKIDSTLVLDGRSNLMGPLNVRTFSKVRLDSDSAIDGDLTCQSGGIASCVDPLDVTGDIQDCGLLCVKP